MLSGGKVGSPSPLRDLRLTATRKGTVSIVSTPISTDGGNDGADVDHVFPWSLRAAPGVQHQRYLEPRSSVQEVQ